MRHDPERADAPERWLRNARSDLAIARAPLPPGAMHEHLCFHAQQTAEKSLKAVLVHVRAEFPFTHNLQVLIDLLAAHCPVPTELQQAVDLSPYSVVARYPGEMEPVTCEEYERAVNLAEAVFQWAQGVVGHGTSEPV